MSVVRATLPSEEWTSIGIQLHSQDTKSLRAEYDICAAPRIPSPEIVARLRR